MTSFPATINCRPSVWSRLMLVMAFIAMNILAGVGSAMSAAPIAISNHTYSNGMLIGEASTGHHDERVPFESVSETGADDATEDCPSHRDGGSNCCSASCLMLGLPVESFPSIAPEPEAHFIVASPQLAAGLFSANLRPPRA